MEIINGLLRGTIEVKRGELVLRALNTAVRNSRRVRFANANGMIRELPQYADSGNPPQDATSEG